MREPPLSSASIAEKPRITKPMRLEASGGPVRIGDMSAPAGGGMSAGLLGDDLILTGTGDFIAMVGEDGRGESGTAGTGTTDTTTDPDDPGAVQDPTTLGAKDNPVHPTGTHTIPAADASALLLLAGALTGAFALRCRRGSSKR